MAELDMEIQSQQRLIDQVNRDIKKKSAKLSKLKNKINKAKDIAEKGKALAKAALSPWSLLSKIDLSIDWTYFAGFLVAILKDISDFSGLGSLPAIGTSVSFMASFFIGSMMLLANFLDERNIATFEKKILQFLVLILGTILEFVLGLNFVPWETITAFSVFMMALAFRKEK